MGHRALVAVARPDGTFDVHRSQFGGADLSLARALDPADPAADSRVDGDPLASAVGRERLQEAVLAPAVHELLVVVDDEVTAFRVLALAPFADGGALVPVDPADPLDDAAVRGWRDGAGDALRAVEPDDDAAAAALAAAVADRYGDRDPEWVGGAGPPGVPAGDAGGPPPDERL